MHLPLQRLIAVILILGLAGAARADIDVTSVSLSDTVNSNINDASLSGKGYGYSTTSSPGPYTGSYHDNYVSVSTNNSATVSLTSPGPVSGISFTLSSASTNSNPNSSNHALSGASGEVEYKGSFTVTTTGQYSLSITTAVNAAISTSGSGAQDGYSATGYVSDQTAGGGDLIFVSYADNQGIYSGTPSRSTVTTLYAGHTYNFDGLVNSGSQIRSDNGWTASGTDNGDASLTFDLEPLVATPEPSTLIPTSLAVVLGLCHAYRRRRAAA